MVVRTIDLMSSPDLTQLAWDLASDGFVGRENAVRQLVATARSRGVSPVATAVLVDVTEAEVARLRAFGIVAAQLAAGTSRPAVAHAA